MPLIFISYKRSKRTNSIAQKVFDELTRDFDSDSTFRDEESLDDGDNIRKNIADSIAQCDIFVVLIDDFWKQCITSDDANSREWIVYEIKEALRAKHVRLFSVLLDGTEMPSREDFPSDIVDFLDIKAASNEKDEIRLSSLENFQEKFPYLKRRLVKFIKGSVRPLPNVGMPNIEQYRNEVKYCLEGNLGELSNPICRLYLDILLRHFNDIGRFDSQDIEILARRPFALFRVMMIEFVENLTTQEQDMSVNGQTMFISLTGEPLRYLNRLGEIFNIPAWKAMDIREKLEEDLDYLITKMVSYCLENNINSLYNILLEVVPEILFSSSKLPQRLSIDQSLLESLSQIEFNLTESNQDYFSDINSNPYFEDDDLNNAIASILQRVTPRAILINFRQYIFCIDNIIGNQDAKIKDQYPGVAAGEIGVVEYTPTLRANVIQYLMYLRGLMDSRENPAPFRELFTKIDFPIPLTEDFVDIRLQAFAESSESAF